MSKNLIFNGNIKLNTNPSWAWKVISNPFYFCCWSGYTPHTTWQVNSPIRLTIGPKLQQFDSHGIVIEFTEGKSFAFSVWSPMSFAENKPENYTDVRFVLQIVKEKIQIDITVSSNTTNPNFIEYLQREWKKALKGIKKTIEDEYLQEQYKNQTF